MDEQRKKKLLNLGSIVSAAGLAFYFLGRALALPEMSVTVVTFLAVLVGTGTLLGMIALRQDAGKEGVSYNRMFGQAALEVLLALATVVVWKGLA